MMDCNEDVWSDWMQQFLNDVGMKEVIHDRRRSQAPGTYIDGKVPIDGIFSTCAVTIQQGGYTSFEQGVQGQRTDHQCLWVDIETEALFGSKTTPLMQFQGT